MAPLDREPSHAAGDIAAVGYGDGYPRNAASGTPVLVNGERAGFAGRVSMDMIGIDVTDRSGAARIGDPVVLWGEGLPVEEIARWAETIPTRWSAASPLELPRPFTNN